MTLADLASIGSFISGLGVLITLIYLGLQVRQAKLHQQGTIRQGRASRINKRTSHITVVVEPTAKVAPAAPRRATATRAAKATTRQGGTR